MKKRLLTLVLCAVMLAVLGGVYFAVSNNKKNAVSTETDETATPTPSYPSLADGSAEELVKFSLNDMTFELNESGQWKSEKYPDLRIKQSDVTSGTRYVASLAPNGLVSESSENLSDFGLSPEKVLVTGYFLDGTEQSFLVGDPTPGKEKYYAKIPGSDTVYTIAAYTGDFFNRTYADFIDTSLPEIDLGNLREMRFYNGGVVMEGVYSDAETKGYEASSLILSSPIAGKAVYLDTFNTSVMEPLAALTFNDIVEFDAYNEQTEAYDSKYGLDSPRLSLMLKGITVDAETGEQTGAFDYQLTVGGVTEDGGDYSYAAIAGMPCVFKLDNSLLAPLFAANPYRMMDRFIALIYLDTVDEILVDAGKTYIMKINPYKSQSEDGKTENDEIAPTLDGVPVKDKLFRSLYQVLVGLSIDAVIDGFSPEGKPELTVTYKTNDGSADNVTEYYSYDDNFLAVAQNGECHFVVNRASVDRMIQDIELIKGGAETLE